LFVQWYKNGQLEKIFLYVNGELDSIKHNQALKLN